MPKPGKQVSAGGVATSQPWLSSVWPRRLDVIAVAGGGTDETRTRSTTLGRNEISAMIYGER